MGYKNPEDRRAYNNAWYARNTERIKEQRNEWARKHPDERKLACRNWKLKRDFDMTQDDWNVRFEQQGRCCAICGCTTPRGGRWAVDHDHLVNRVRAILCMLCNTAIGKMTEDPVLLRKAAQYLEQHREAMCSLSEKPPEPC